MVHRVFARSAPLSQPRLGHASPERVVSARAGVDDVRVDRLLLGSDWPHAEGTRHPVDFVTESLSGLPDEHVRRIGRDNALDVLRVSVG